MRAFVALELPAPFEDGVAALARQLRPSVDGRFMDRSTYHLTLAFLGEVGEGQVRAAMDALDGACAGLPSIPLSAKGLGTFGRASDATLWLGIEPCPELLDLVRRVRAALDACGIAFDVKPFKPHITLARRARVRPGAAGGLAFPRPGRASSVSLFKSVLAREGAAYASLYRVRLG